MAKINNTFTLVLPCWFTALLISSLSLPSQNSLFLSNLRGITTILVPDCQLVLLESRYVQKSYSY